MRPVKKGPKPNAYSPASSLTFQDVKGIVQAALKTKTPTVSECLGLWLDVAKARMSVAKKKSVVVQQKEKANEEAMKVIEPKIAAEYKKAALPLIQKLGDYCSFCETRSAGHLDVEHVAPKSQYPRFALDWDNFLLACGPCNTAKSLRPTRVDLQKKPYLNHDITSEAECHDEIRKKHFVWPDTMPDSYRLLPTVLLYRNNQGNLAPIPIAAAFDTNVQWHSTNLLKEEVKATFPQMGNQTFCIEAHVLHLNPPSNPPSRPAELIGLCKLNKTGNASYDRRVLNRTRAWLDALADLALLKSLAGKQSPFDFVWKSVFSKAVATGFFSVWLRVFHGTATFKPVDPHGVRLSKRLCDEFQNGTDKSQLP